MQKIRKKTWDILRELTTGKTGQVQIDKINVNGKTISEPIVMANEFNSFFTRVGRNIADSVEPSIGEIYGREENNKSGTTLCRFVSGKCAPHCFKFTGKFQQIYRRVAVQTVYGRFFSGALFPVDGLGNSGRIQLLKLLEFSIPSTGIFQ